MAGNIIPAIATTNAITAGVVVLRAFSVLLEQYDLCQSVYVRLRLNPRNQIFVPDRGTYTCFDCRCHSILFLKFMNSFIVVYRFDGTKSKMHRLLG